MEGGSEGCCALPWVGWVESGGVIVLLSASAWEGPTVGVAGSHRVI